MYRKDKSIQVVGSASMLTNNVTALFTKGMVHITVAHKTVASIVSAAIDGSSHTQNQISSKENNGGGGSVIILQAKMMQMANRIILVMCTQRGVQMFETDGGNMIHWHALEDSKNANDASCHARGICSVGTDTVCVGTFLGQILVFAVPAKGTNVTLAATLTDHESPIADLASTTTPKSFVSCNDNGDITLWKYNQSYKPVLKIPGYGYPCCMAVWRDVVAAGYGSGHIRIFSISNGHIGAEVAAHARWITGMDVTQSGILLSTSDDTFVRIWQLKEGNPPTIDHHHSESIANLQLVGGCFTTPDGKLFCVTGYDSNELLFYGK